VVTLQLHFSEACSGLKLSNLRFYAGVLQLSGPTTLIRIMIDSYCHSAVEMYYSDFSFRRHEACVIVLSGSGRSAERQRRDQTVIFSAFGHCIFRISRDKARICFSLIS